MVLEISPDIDRNSQAFGLCKRAFLFLKSFGLVNPQVIHRDGRHTTKMNMQMGNGGFAMEQRCRLGINQRHKPVP